VARGSLADNRNLYRELAKSSSPARTREQFFQPASTVVPASFTLNNSRLLLLSKIGTPYDPNTRKDTLGRNLTHQVEPSL